MSILAWKWYTSQTNFQSNPGTATTLLLVPRLLGKGHWIVPSSETHPIWSYTNRSGQAGNVHAIYLPSKEPLQSNSIHDINNAFVKPSLVLKQLGCQIAAHNAYTYPLNYHFTIEHCTEAIATQHLPQVLAQNPFGLLEDVFVIHDWLQWPQPFSCEQVYDPGGVSLQLLLLLLGELAGLLPPLGDEGFGPSYALTYNTKFPHVSAVLCAYCHMLL